MTGDESTNCLHCGKAIALPKVEEDGAVLTKIREPKLGGLGGPMAR